MAIENLPNKVPSVSLTTERNVSGALVKNLLNSCEVAKNARLQSEIATLYNFDYNAPPLKFPYEEFYRLAEYLARRLYPGRDLQAGLEELGYRSVMHFFQMPLGQVLRITSGVLGPYRGVRIYAQFVSKQFPWSNIVIEQAHPPYIRLHIQKIAGRGSMFRGSFRGCVEIAGGKIKRLTTTVINEEDIIHEIELE